MNYWYKRNQEIQEKIQDKSIKEIQFQLSKYYGQVAEKVISDFEAVYNKVQNSIDKDKQPTPADLYKLDKYWQALAQMKKELEKLGNRQISILSSAFKTDFIDVYNSLALPTTPTFGTVDKEVIDQVLNKIWVADGKHWSQRVWDNTERLAQTLNEELIHCLATGRKDSELKNILMERFNVSYHRAETLVRTETAHIQTESARQRYKDYGIQYVEVLVDPDDRTCDKCKALIGKKWRIDETPPLPLHPNERCCLVPVVPS